MKVKNFAGFMKTRKLNENDNWENSEEGYGDEYADDSDSGYYGANPEDDEDADADANAEEGADEELTLEDLKAMIDDLTERVKKLEPEEEDEEGADEGEEGAAEGEEAAEGEAKPEV